MTMINAYSSEGAERLGARARTLIARRERALGPAYRLFYEEPVEAARAEGVWLYDPDGNAYLDVYNNVACVGHCHPHVVAALAAQAAELNTHTRYLNERVLDYAERMLATMPDAIGHIMFTCTGSEANDLALRIARAHTGGIGMIVTETAYHGVTQAIAELSPSLGAYVKLGDHVRTVPPPRAGGDAFAAGVRSALANMQAVGIKPAALLVDTVFSSDGIFTDPPGFLRDAVDAAREAGAIFIADEVQAGFARTGDAFWGFQRHGLTPDLITMGKPMGNGHPIAAVAARPGVLEAFGRTCRYFNTFGGNPVSCAAGMAVLDVIEADGLLANAKRVGAMMRAGVADLAAKNDGLIADIRGAGLSIGVEIAARKDERADVLAARIVNALRRDRILISATGPGANVLKVRPPLVFSEANADQFLSGLEEVLAAL
ncbi:MAG: aspartate aminotransferase family protein [Hyphomonadaceae bacterium]